MKRKTMAGMAAAFLVTVAGLTGCSESGKQNEGQNACMTEEQLAAESVMTTEDQESETILSTKLFETEPMMSSDDADHTTAVWESEVSTEKELEKGETVKTDVLEEISETEKTDSEAIKAEMEETAEERTEKEDPDLEDAETYTTADMGAAYSTIAVPSTSTTTSQTVLATTSAVQTTAVQQTIAVQTSATPTMTASTSAAPTTAVPTTTAPATTASTTAAPTTAVPMTVAPTTAAPTTAPETSAQNTEEVYASELCRYPVDENGYCKQACMDIFEYQNQVRVKNGQEPLVWSDKMYETAIKCANANANIRTLDHDATFLYRDYEDTMYYENLAGVASWGRQEGQSVQMYIETFEIEDVVDRLMTSEGHRKTMMDSSVKYGAIAMKHVQEYAGAYTCFLYTSQVSQYEESYYQKQYKIWGIPETVKVCDAWKWDPSQSE